MTVRILQGDCLERMAELEAGSVDAVVTDPPYGLAFMGKEWDHGVPGVPFWQAALRVAKPGAHLVAFGGTRTYHRLACAIEDAGWEIRDSLVWCYGSGFPKSHNLDGDWEGFGTALKPSQEPIVLARKPLCGTVAANVTEHGTGALSIEASRVGTERRFNPPTTKGKTAALGSFENCDGHGTTVAGRWPPNLLLSHAPTCTEAECAEGCPVRIMDEQSGELSSGSRKAGNHKRVGYHGDKGGAMPEVVGDSGGASRFFPRFRYEAKASSEERTRGAKHIEARHPTQKPVELMRWLVRLVTPPGGTVLDPFAGSGTTGIAADREGFNTILIEREAEYVEIAEARCKGDSPLFAEVVVERESTPP